MPFRCRDADPMLLGGLKLLEVALPGMSADASSSDCAVVEIELGRGGGAAESRGFALTAVAATAAAVAAAAVMGPLLSESGECSGVLGS